MKPSTKKPKKVTTEIVQARVAVFDFDLTTIQRRRQIAHWLRRVALEIETGDRAAYVRNPLWRLYSLPPKVRKK